MALCGRPMTFRQEVEEITSKLEMGKIDNYDATLLICEAAKRMGERMPVIGTNNGLDPIENRCKRCQAHIAKETEG